MKRLLPVLCVLPLLLLGGCETLTALDQDIFNPHTGKKYTIKPIEKVKGRQVYGQELFDLLAGTTVYVKLVKRDMTGVAIYGKSGSLQIQVSRELKGGGNTVRGTWTTKGSLLCTDIPRFKMDDCDEVYLQGDIIQFVSTKKDYVGVVSYKVIRSETQQVRSYKKPKPKKLPKKPSAPAAKPIGPSSGSGFFISKMGHVVTNQHVVDNCKRISVGLDSRRQSPVKLLSADTRNDLALLRMTSSEAKSLVVKLGIKVIPLASKGLLRSDDVRLGERVMVSGFPYGDAFSSSVKVNSGIVSSIRGFGDDSGQFQLDAAIQPGNSGGPIYDENGNIVGVAVARLNKMKLANVIGSIPENVNFGIKASTVRQFLSSSGLPTKWSSKSTSMPPDKLAKIAESQTVMVVCHQ